MIAEKLRNLGESLKQQRKEKNLSLKEVENATSIRMNYLEAIEKGDLSQLISPIYAQGFLRQYAAYLGVDGDTIIKEHPEIFNKHENQDFAYGIGTLEMRGNPGSSVKWIPNAMWIFTFVLISVSAWYFAKYMEVL